VLAGRDDPTDGLVAEDLPTRHLVVGPLAVALPGVPVAPADAAGLDRDHGSVALDVGRRDRLGHEWFTILFENCGAHTRCSSRTVKSVVDRREPVQ
jgi:hypothetical protein